jgi:hypothetical protein
MILLAEDDEANIVYLVLDRQHRSDECQFWKMYAWDCHPKVYEQLQQVIFIFHSPRLSSYPAPYDQNLPWLLMNGHDSHWQNGKKLAEWLPALSQCLPIALWKLLWAHYKTPSEDLKRQILQSKKVDHYKYANPYGVSRREMWE